MALTFLRALALLSPSGLTPRQNIMKKPGAGSGEKELHTHDCEWEPQSKRPHLCSAAYTGKLSVLWVSLNMSERMFVVVHDTWCIKGSFHLWKDECVFKMGNLCWRNVKLFLNWELSRLRQMYFWLMWMKDNNSQNALASLPYRVQLLNNSLG